MSVYNIVVSYLCMYYMNEWLCCSVIDICEVQIGVIYTCTYTQ
jgi:hypothetical protein